jgi:hypothetical protein
MIPYMSDTSEDIAKTESKVRPRNKKGFREPTSLHVDPKLWQEVRVMAVLKNVSVTEYFEDALRRKIDADNLEVGGQGYRVGQGGMYIPPPSAPAPLQPQSTTTSDSRKQIQQGSHFRIFEKDTVIPKPGERPVSGEKSVEIDIDLPGIKFPITKNRLIDFAKRLDKIYEYDTVAVGGFYNNLFTDLPDKTYTNKQSLEEALVVLNDTGKGYFDNKERIVGVNLLTTKEEIAKSQSEINKRYIDGYFKEVEKYYKEQPELEHDYVVKGEIEEKIIMPGESYEEEEATAERERKEKKQSAK